MRPLRLYITVAKATGRIHSAGPTKGSAMRDFEKATGQRFSTCASFCELLLARVYVPEHVAYSTPRVDAYTRWERIK